jgi:hypothetical protein
VSATSGGEAVAAARRAGVEADESEARQWMLAVASDDPKAVSVDRQSGVFGDHVSLLDFDPAFSGKKLNRLGKADSFNFHDKRECVAAGTAPETVKNLASGIYIE